MTTQPNARPPWEEPGVTEQLAVDRIHSVSHEDSSHLYGALVEYIEERPTSHGLTVTLYCGKAAKLAVRSAIASRARARADEIRAQEKTQLERSNAVRQQAARKPARRGGAA